MSELKQLVEKFIELDDDLNEKIEASLDDNEELPESFEEENADQINELGELYHEIEHLVYNEEFIIVSNNAGEEKEVVALIISEEDEDSSLFLYLPMKKKQTLQSNSSKNSSVTLNLYAKQDWEMKSLLIITKMMNSLALPSTLHNGTL